MDVLCKAIRYCRFSKAWQFAQPPEITLPGTSAKSDTFAGFNNIDTQ
jgi:hypothetical protein